MAEKCLIAASLTALVFHPSSSIKCFKRGDATSPEIVSHALSKRSPSKSKKKQGFHSKPSSNKNSKEARTRLKAPSPSFVRTIAQSNEVSELHEGEWPIDIVATVFSSGWPLLERVAVHKVLKVNPSVDVLNNFEKYREGVKSVSVKNNCESKRAQKLMADGNELLRFHGALTSCSLGKNGVSGICQKQCCAVCRIVSSSFPVKDASVSFYENSWTAHENINRESVAETTGARARTAIIICRVIAGRIANYHELKGAMDEDEGGFDSVVSRTGSQSNGSEELVVLNQRAILPCFMVIYSVK